MENVANGSDIVTINGRPRHIIGYLQDFLFSPERCQSPISALSGGERNRLLLARLFAKPSNLLVLDEPTNDLDLETLEILENLIQDYPGTLLLVSHDRFLLDHVVTSTLVLQGAGKVTEYVGGFDDWLSRFKPDTSTKKGKPSAKPEKTTIPKERPRKISFKEQRELEALPHRIEELEREQHLLYQAMAEPVFYQQESSRIAIARDRLKVLEDELDEAFKRWEILEDLQKGGIISISPS